MKEQVLIAMYLESLNYRLISPYSECPVDVKDLGLVLNNYLPLLSYCESLENHCLGPIGAFPRNVTSLSMRSIKIFSIVYHVSQKMFIMEGLVSEILMH